MTLDQVKTLDNKIKANKAQYDLDREAAKISALSSDELEKFEYLTGEDLRYKSDVIEKAKFEYSPFRKVFNKRLDKSDKKEGLLKRLKNIKDKNNEQLDEIEYQGERKLDAIEKQVKKQLKVIHEQKKKQLKEIKTQKIKMEEKPEMMMLLRDELNDILVNYDMNINFEGKNILIELARDEKLISYNNLLFKTGDPTISNCNFLETFGALHRLLIDLLSGEISATEAPKEQDTLLDKTEELKRFILLEEKSINRELTKGSRKQRIKHREIKLLRYEKNL